MKIRHIAIASVAAAGLIAAACAHRPPQPTPAAAPPPMETESVMATTTFLFAGLPQMYPDPRLTPGSLNPRVSQANIAQTICNRNWQTGSIRDTVSSPAQKNTTYNAYGIPHPANNSGGTQLCELDHLISLENGGGDGLPNIWPECGPNYPGNALATPLKFRYFKMKDAVENYVHNGICLAIPNAKFSQGPKPSKPLSLAEGQAILAHDWYACFQKMVAGQDCN